ncbi:MAG TPA: protein-disulfide reductase DsbD family protein [Flavobacteriales bacterium]|nr:protein-disulfide reductase DsbD family protein [Flavobacteriales bacterium]
MRALLSFLSGLLFIAVQAQPPGADTPEEPTRWSISAEQIGDDWNLVFTARIEHGWSVYSTNNYGDMGPWPTSIKVDPTAGRTIVGVPTETGHKVIEGVDEMFGMVVKKFKEEAVFTQRIKVDDPSAPVTGSFEYMTCNDEMCLPPTTVFFIVPGLTSGKFELSGFPIKGDALTKAVPAVQEPVVWTLATEKVKDGLWRLRYTAAVQDGWYIYSQESFGDGPIPTSFVLDSAVAHARFMAKAVEDGKEMHQGMDEMFGIEVRKYEHAVSFAQEVYVTDEAKDITGVVNYQACDDTQCIFPDPVPFTVNLSTGAISIGVKTVTAGGECKYKLSTVDLDSPVVPAPVAEGGDGASAIAEGPDPFWLTFLKGFLGGLLALITPCFFPMIPLTVSFFTKGEQSKKKGIMNGLLYGFFIFAIYVLCALPFHLVDSISGDIFNDISTNQWLNAVFFIVFLVFAFSFFGYYEITLPSSWVNRMDQNASKYTGVLGTFFMALVLVLVSFSCTGLILGTLLAGTVAEGPWPLTVGLAGFGLALALPFALFAMFPSWLNSLPRSGGWLNSVKVVLGFAEVALAFKFLSNADLVKQWHIVPYELFMVVWIVCSIGIVLYLFGVIRFPHDSPVKSRSALRWGFIALFTVVTGYLAFGLRVDKEKGTFTPLALMSGLAPPVWYSWILPAESEVFHDLDEALAHAKAVGKPVMLDFTGWACVNCRKMEEHVWPVDGVKEIIENDYVLVSLYVDDKRELPKEQQHEYVTCTGKQKLILTKGNKWSTVQLETFVISSQPYYALLSPEGKLLTDPVGYTPDVTEYKSFLERGLEGMRTLGLQASR